MYKSTLLHKQLIFIFIFIAFLLTWTPATTALFWKKSNLWENMGSAFSLEKNAPPSRLQPALHELSHDQEFFNIFSKNASLYMYYVYQETSKRHMPAEIALIPIIESDYYPFAYETSGAEGLWQLMPETAADTGITMNWWFDGRRDITSSTKAALGHLEYLHQHYGDWLVAIAAYDCGEVDINAAIAHNKKLHLPTDYWSLKLPKETEEYIPKLLALATIIKNSQHYPVKLGYVANSPLFTQIPLNKQINLQEFAQMIHINNEVLLRLNPAFRRWVTPPHNQYNLTIPIDKLHVALNELQQLTTKNLWLHYQVTKNDSLGILAARYHMSIETLENINQLSSSHIKVGQTLNIPINYAKNDKTTPIVNNDIITAYHHHGPPNYYRVQSGDNLIKIAQQFHTSIFAIKQANHLTANTVTDGDLLSIPEA